jgi:hypothetical protein
MTQQIIEIEAESLEDAREQLKSRIPEGLSVLSEKIISDGNPKTVTAAATSTEAAFAKAESQIPSNANVIAKQEVSAFGQKVVTVEAFDEQTAKSLVRTQVGNDAVINDPKIAIPGKQGLMGIGKKPHQYQVEVFEQAVVEITYKTKAKISAEIGKQQKTVATVMRDFLIRKEDEGEFSELGLDIIDVLGSIVNSGFSNEQIQKGLHHRNPKIRSLTQEFLSEIEKLQE